MKQESYIQEEAEAVRLANLVITDKVVKDIKKAVNCGCHHCELDAEDEIDWLLYPTKPDQKYKDNIFSRLRHGRRT